MGVGVAGVWPELPRLLARVGVGVAVGANVAVGDGVMVGVAVAVAVGIRVGMATGTVAMGVSKGDRKSVPPGFDISNTSDQSDGSPPPSTARTWK